MLTFLYSFFISFNPNFIASTWETRGNKTNKSFLVNYYSDIILTIISELRVFPPLPKDSTFVD